MKLVDTRRSKPGGVIGRYSWTLGFYWVLWVALALLGCAEGEVSTGGEDLLEESGRCGDNIIQTSLGEDCDDGNLTSGDGCSSECQAEAVSHEIVCDDNKDDDRDGKVDCSDPDCSLSSACVSTGESSCVNGEDDDEDGDTDCQDDDCTGRACGDMGQVCKNAQCVCHTGHEHEVVCDDVQDDDCDGKVDCFDEDCADFEDCIGTESNCTDGIDNEDDGDTDCEDSDCAGQLCGNYGVVCQGGACVCPNGETESDCDDDVDNDCDGAIDCFDDECTGDTACINTETSCVDGVDNDGDGDTDCADTDCANQTCGENGYICYELACACPGGQLESACSDNQDNDCDAMVDCNDPDCSSHISCIESDCNDGQDNDGDGDADCEDSDCNGLSCGAAGRICSGGSCICPGGNTETACSDLTDNDCDQLVDCNDDDCADLPACNPNGNCTKDLSLLCGWYHDGDTSSMTSELTSYGCASSLSETGGEYIYEFVATTDISVNLALTGASQDLDLFVMKDEGNGNPDCNADESCYFSGTSSSGEETVSFTAEAGGFYYFAVDGAGGASDSYQLEVSCTGGSSCLGAAIVGCGFDEEWNNSGGGSTNNVTSYGSCFSSSETGPEYSYIFIPDVSGTANVTMVSDVDLDVFVLPFNGAVCDSSQCMASDASSGDAEFSFAVTAGEAYFVVVDGYSGATGDYLIEITCN